MKRFNGIPNPHDYNYYRFTKHQDSTEVTFKFSEPDMDFRRWGYWFERWFEYMGDYHRKNQLPYDSRIYDAYEIRRIRWQQWDYPEGSEKYLELERRIEKIKKMGRRCPYTYPDPNFSFRNFAYR